MFGSDPKWALPGCGFRCAGPSQMIVWAVLFQTWLRARKQRRVGGEKAQRGSLRAAG